LPFGNVERTGVCRPSLEEVHMNTMITARQAIVGSIAAVFLVAVAGAVRAQQPAGNTDADYMAKVRLAAPEAIVKNATVVAMGNGGAMRTVQNGTNDFTCMLMPDTTPMCTDKNGMLWMHAMMTHSAPPNAIGFMYMLNGDAVGASNTDPFATAPTPANHWVKTGPHVMILGPGTKSLGYSRTADADPTKPYVMWAGTPYEHVMIPVK
jgi:hypothetical protein